MKVVIPGGTGQVGRVLARGLAAEGHRVVILSRRAAGSLGWDGRTWGPWAEHLEGADAVINLAGRSVNCRYHKANLTEMLASRLDSTAAVGAAIAACRVPPRVWLQMSTATIYAHTFGPGHGDDGPLGGHEPGVPGYWRFSVEIARAWERTQAEARTPATRQVALRTAMVMSPDRGGIFDLLLRLARRGLGGPIAGGGQFMSWIHEADLVRAVLLLIEREDLRGPVNLSSPQPLPQRDFMAALRQAARVPFGLPATRAMVELGTLLLGSDSELVLKSRRVLPRRLLEAGFVFRHPDWPAAARELLSRS